MWQLRARGAHFTKDRRAWHNKSKFDLKMGNLSASWSVIDNTAKHNQELTEAQDFCFLTELALRHINRCHGDHIERPGMWMQNISYVKGNKLHIYFF